MAPQEELPTGTEQPTEQPTEEPTEQETEPPVPALLPPGGVPTDELVAEISAAYEQKTGHTWKYRYEEYHHGDDPVQAITNYYGTYGDCAVLYDEGDIIDVRDIMVGEYRFQAGSPLFIDVYRNGEIGTLQEAYDNGWITNEQLREIWVYHYLTRGIVGIQENPPPA